MWRYILLVVLQVLDGLFTYIGVTRLGLAVEGNPIVRWLMGHLGPFYARQVRAWRSLSVLSVDFSMGLRSFELPLEDF